MTFIHEIKNRIYVIHNVKYTMIDMKHEYYEIEYNTNTVTVHARYAKSFLVRTFVA